MTSRNILVRMREKGLLDKDEALIKLDALEKYGRYKASIVKDVLSRLEGIE